MTGSSIGRTIRGCRASLPLPRVLLRGLLLASMFFTMTSCARRMTGAPPGPFPPTREEFFARFADSDEALESLRAQILIDFFFPNEKPRTLSGDLLYEAPDRFRLRASMGTIATVLEVVVRGDEYVILFPSEHVAVPSDSADPVLEGIGHPFDARTLALALALATGTPPDSQWAFTTPEDAAVVLTEHEDGKEPSPNTERPRREFRFDPATSEIEEIRVFPSGLRISFSERRKVEDVKVPYRVIFRELVENARLEIRIRRAEGNPKIPPRVFDLTPPSGYETPSRAELADRLEALSEQFDQ